MAIEVFGRATSSNVQAVMWTTAELGLTVTRHDVGHTYGGTETSEFRAMNPMGKVPVLKDGDLTLFESAAIVRYLAARYGQGRLWPDDPADRARLDVWAEWIKTSFAPLLLTRLFYPLVRFDPDLLDAQDMADATREMADLATMLDRRIGAGPWLAGDRFTWADIMAGHLLYRYHALPFERAGLPDLAAYYARLMTRPAYKAHVCVSYEPLRFRP